MLPINHAWKEGSMSDSDPDDTTDGFGDPRY